MILFDDSKSVGLIFEIVGALMAVNSIALIVGGTNDMIVPLIEETENPDIFYMVYGGGSLIASLIYILYAHTVMKGKFDNKLDVLAGYVRVVGVTTMIIVIGESLGEYLCGIELALTLLVAVIGTILGITVILISFSMNNGKKTKGKRILWWILVMAFAIMVIYNFMPAESYLDLVYMIAHLLIGLFMLLFLFDPEVKMEMCP
jgi:hypothetical protein